VEAVAVQVPTIGPQQPRLLLASYALCVAFALASYAWSLAAFSLAYYAWSLATLWCRQKQDVGVRKSIIGFTHNEWDEEEMNPIIN